MITKLTHTGIHVLNQERACEFYTNKLGFTIVTDVPMGKDRWLTVCPPGNPEFEIILSPVKETEKELIELIKKGTFGFGVFECNDLYVTCEELKAKGVEFMKEPKEEFYGIEALIKDDSGNWFSLLQKSV